MSEASPTVQERLAKIETKLEYIQSQLNDIKSIGKWLVIVLGGVVLTAFANFVLHGGLAVSAAGVG